MQLNELEDWLNNELAFPTEKATVIDRAGDRLVDAPDAEDSETLAVLLDRGGKDTFDTSAELIDVIRGSVSEGYIGRKYYDDRGANHSSGHGPTEPDTVDISF